MALYGTGNTASEIVNRFDCRLNRKSDRYLVFKAKGGNSFVELLISAVNPDFSFIT